MGNWAAFFVALAIVGVVFEMLRRKKLREKYAALWILVGIGTLILAAFPSLLTIVAERVGVQLPSNLLFIISILLLLGVCLHLSWELSAVEDETRTLAEEVAILRTMVEDISSQDSGGDPAVEVTREGPMTLDIFIPYWGDVSYMKQAVDSVLAQSNPDWRLTVVDDAYPSDDVRRYVEAIDDSRITYIHKESNEGITENFRTCVRLASQNVLVVMGCDDVLLPNFVDVVLRAHAEYPEASIIQPGVQVINENGAPSVPLVDIVKQRLLKPRATGPRLLGGERLAVSLLHGDWLYWPSLAFRRDRIRDYDFRDGFPVIQDLALIMDMVLGGATLLVLPEICFKYRRHTSSASSAKLVDGSRFVGERDFFNLAAALCTDRGWHRAARAARLRLTSRAHALLIVADAVRQGAVGMLGLLLRHAFGK